MKYLIRSFAVPVATIDGSEMFVDVGSTINITCVVRNTPNPPSEVQWRHKGKVGSEVVNSE